MKAPIQSTKHIYQQSLATITTTNIANIQPIISVAKTTEDADNEVAAGAVVKAIWVEIWITSDDAAQSIFNFTVEKRAGNTSAMTYANSTALNDYAGKKNILFCSQGLTPTNVGTPTPVHRGWIRIPKGKQRFGLDDRLVCNISSLATGVNYCGIFVYKAYN